MTIGHKHQEVNCLKNIQITACQAVFVIFIKIFKLLILAVTLELLSLFLNLLCLSDNLLHGAFYWSKILLLHIFLTHQLRR